jgi:putative ABC transport system ATP-binding protein
MLCVEEVRLAYRSGPRWVEAVAGVSLEVPKGIFAGLIGPSGSGKSSLLYLMSGLRRPTSGQVVMAGHPLHELPEPELARLRRQHFGFVFQQSFLIGYLTALENVLVAALPARSTRHEARSAKRDRGRAASRLTSIPASRFVLRAARSEHCEEERRARELMVRVGLEGMEDRFPHQLSGGERQRVAVARALVASPSIIFADEPTASLDRATGRQVIELLAAQRESGSLVVVTHDPDMLASADRLWRMRDGQLAE